MRARVAKIDWGLFRKVGPLQGDDGEADTEVSQRSGGCGEAVGEWIFYALHKRDLKDHSGLGKRPCTSKAI
jgi:hypothetical protein